MLRIRVLGETLVETADGAIDRAWLSQRPGRLLRYLVCERGHFVPPDQIVEALWPGSVAGADENVRYLVHLLRRRLEPQRPPRGRSLSVECVGGAYALGSSVWIDAQPFEELVEDGLRAAQRGEHEAAFAQLDRALGLYRGDFLCDEPYADWAMIERERVRALAEDALRAAAELCEWRCDLGRALEYARWLAEMGRYDSDVQLRVIRLCLSCGRRSEAARRYGAFRARLLREFGQEPEFDLATASAASRRATAHDLRSRCEDPFPVLADRLPEADERLKPAAGETGEEPVDQHFDVGEPEAVLEDPADRLLERVAAPYLAGDLQLP